MNLAPDLDRRFVETPFRRTANGVAFREFGAGEPLVLMHGGAGSWQHWVRNVDALASAFRVIAIDQPSYGDSTAVAPDISNDDYLAVVAEAVAEIATRLQVPESDVVAMNRRLSAQDQSLNVAIGGDGGDEWQDWLVDGSDDQEGEFARSEETLIRRRHLRRAMVGLNRREQRIFIARRLDDDPLTLEALSKEYDISRERVRQIESKAFEKVQKSILRSHAEQQRAVRETLNSLA